MAAGAFRIPDAMTLPPRALRYVTILSFDHRGTVRRTPSSLRPIG